MLLWAVWNPIGSIRLTEYEAYVLPVWKLLARDAETEEIAAQLTQFRTVHIGLKPDPQTDEDAALTVQLWWSCRFEWLQAPEDSDPILPELSD